MSSDGLEVETSASGLTNTDVSASSSGVTATASATSANLTAISCTPIRLRTPSKSCSASRAPSPSPSGSNSNSNSTGGGSGSGGGSGGDRKRSPIPATLRSAASFRKLRRPSLPSISVGTTQKLTVVGVPARMQVQGQGQGEGEGAITDVSGIIVGAGAGVASGSSASSIVGLDMSGAASVRSGRSEEGVLVQDGASEMGTEVESDNETETETETETNDGDVREGDKDTDKDVEATPTTKLNNDGCLPEEDERSRRRLREHLRRTLDQQREWGSNSCELSQGSLTGEESEVLSINAVTPRQYYVLTDAGKPVFASQSSTLSNDTDALTSTMGLIQALISIFLDDGDKLRSINAGRMRINFLLRSPLYFVCVSDWGEPDSVTRSHLEYLHLQILSVISGLQLRRIFERHMNFDIRRLLSGAETFLHLLLERMQTDLAISTSSLLCLPMETGLRRKIGEMLIPSKMKDILYVMLVARGRVVTLVRPKKHSVHPADLHILLNTINAPAVANSPASWLPVCLPKFNPSGFLHAYVSFIRQSESHVNPSNPSHDEEGDQSSQLAQTDSREDVGLRLVCISGGGGGDFETIRSWCETVTKNLETTGTMDTLEQNICRERTEYDISVLSIPGLRHFVYKSRAHVQITHPEWGEDYADAENRRRLITLYQTLHDAIHGKSGQKEILKLQYIRTEHESVMGWITQPFELYLVAAPTTPKASIVGAANSIARWVKREESRLFLRDAPVF